MRSPGIRDKTPPSPNGTGPQETMHSTISMGPRRRWPRPSRKVRQGPLRTSGPCSSPSCLRRWLFVSGAYHPGLWIGTRSGALRVPPCIEAFAGRKTRKGPRAVFPSFPFLPSPPYPGSLMTPRGRVLTVFLRPQIGEALLPVCERAPLALPRHAPAREVIDCSAFRLERCSLANYCQDLIIYDYASQC